MDPPCYNYLNIFLVYDIFRTKQRTMTSLPGNPLFYFGDLLQILAVAIKRLVNSFPIKSFGQLVLLSFAITDFTPAAYLRRSLRRPF